MDRGKQGIGRLPVPLLVLAGLVLVSIAAQLAVWPVHFLRKATAREEMEHRMVDGLSREATTLFRFSCIDLNSVDLLDGGRELGFGGFVYDVLSVERTEDSVMVTAIRDDKETGLIHLLDRLIRAEMEGNEEGQEESSGAMSPWAPFHEAWQAVSLRGLPDRQLYFACMAPGSGRDRDPIEPSPPRRG